MLYDFACIIILLVRWFWTFIYVFFLSSFIQTIRCHTFVKNQSRVLFYLSLLPTHSLNSNEIMTLWKITIWEGSFIRLRKQENNRIRDLLDHIYRSYKNMSIHFSFRQELTKYYLRIRYRIFHYSFKRFKQM